MRVSPQHLRREAEPMAPMPDLSLFLSPSVRAAAGARAVRAGLLCLGLAAGVAAPSAAFAQSEKDFWNNTLEILGLKDEEPKPEIDYRERAPLVVPPKAPESLPPPQESAANANPNWPKDPDVARRAREAEAAKQPVVRDDPGRPLLPSELNSKGKRRTLSGSQSPTEPVPTGSQRDVLMPDQLGFKSWMNGLTGKQDQLTFNGEPERENLIQPPAGYQTPAPNAPYGVVEEKKEPFKFPTLFDRQ